METKAKAKKTYKKPKVTQVRLEIGEAVLAGCKAFVGDPAGKGNKTCDHPGCKHSVSPS